MITFINDIRSLTISSIFVKSRWSKSLKPKLILSGDWMNEAGFTIGEKVTVQVMDNKLIITKDDIQN